MLSGAQISMAVAAALSAKQCLASADRETESAKLPYIPLLTRVAE